MSSYSNGSTLTLEDSMFVYLFIELFLSHLFYELLHAFGFMVMFEMQNIIPRLLCMCVLRNAFREFLQNGTNVNLDCVRIWMSRSL